MFKSSKKFISMILIIMMIISSFSVSVFSAGAAIIDDADSDAFLEDATVYWSLIIGDVDLDGDPNVKDATQIQMYIANYVNFNGYQMIAADTDKNNDINVRDATNVQLHAGGYNTDYDDNYVGTPILIQDDDVPTNPTETEATETAPTETEPFTPAPTTEPVPDTTAAPEPTTAPTDPTITEPKYIVAGGQNLCGSHWDRYDENNLMTYNAATGRYEKVYVNLKNSTFEYMIANNGEFVAFDRSSETGNIRFTVDIIGTNVTIWFKPETGEYGQELTEPTFVVAGSQSLCGSAWNKADQNNKMIYNSSTGRFEKVYQLNKGTYEYKIARNGTEFVFTDTSVDTGNIKFTVNVDNTKVTIWYKPNSNEHGREVVEPPTTEPTSSSTNPTEQATYGTEAVPMKGIDVSVHNGGSIDFHKVKAAGIQFVIIRGGYGQVASQKDGYFETNYLKAKAAGLKVGVYWYSYASTTAAAITEANVCLSVISGKQFEFPIYFDLEESSQFAKGSTFCNTLITNFCTTVEKAGYFSGLYMSRSPLTTYISSDIRNTYSLWVAEYASSCKYTGTYGMWQYSSTGKVNGISGNVDMNTGYVDYSGVIRNKGFNGFPKLGNGINPQLPIDQIVKEVFDGKWGNGDERKQRLIAAGYDYNVVQYRIEEYLAAGTRP